VARTDLVVLAIVGLLAGCGARGDADDQALKSYVLDLDSGSGRSDATATPVAGALQPGDYSPASFKPAMTFSVEEGWTLAYDSPLTMLLFVGDADPPGFVHLVRVSAETKVAEPPVADGRDPPPALEPFPEDYEAWLRAAPHIEVGPRRSTEIGGAEGFAVDIELSGLPPGFCGSVESNKQCFYPVELYAITAVPAASLMTARLIDVDGSSVLVFTDSDLYPDESASMLASIRWDVPE
jgi:hypothetical protein